MSYALLRDWYANAIAVLVPLAGDPDDTSGYTSLLEAIAMRKPVIMTRSGCLDLDVEGLGIGKFVPPQDDKAWKKSLEVFSPGYNAVATPLYTPGAFAGNLGRFLHGVMDRSAA